MKRQPQCEGLRLGPTVGNKRKSKSKKRPTKSPKAIGTSIQRNGAGGQVDRPTWRPESPQIRQSRPLREKVSRAITWSLVIAGIISIPVTLITFLGMFGNFANAINIDAQSPVRTYLPGESSMRPEFHGDAPSSTFRGLNTTSFTLRYVHAYCISPYTKYDGNRPVQVTNPDGSEVDPARMRTGDSRTYTLAPGDSFTFQCTLGFIGDPKNLPFPDYSAIPEYSKMRVIVYYRVLWLIPWHRRFRFETERNEKGELLWNQRPE